ncbi:putative Zn finger protein [Paenibacillus sp. PastF-3]|uniref:hypothetical protein n=1 Tax=Paenibacillus sp. PastF-3 TaxID=2940626 RepID=UPI002476A18F|nr:hypothetical protein [Paenibacillus sp. PastF-3]MDH6373526.1 putative Zn finger protein [Paenibacillus sp. PastF-3]
MESVKYRCKTCGNTQTYQGIVVEGNPQMTIHLANSNTIVMKCDDCGAQNQISSSDLVIVEE